MKRLFLFVCWTLLALSGVEAQQFAKTGVVNLTRIMTQFYKESKSVREFEDLKGSLQKRIDQMKEEIRQLIDQKTEAQRLGDRIKLQTIESEIQTKQEAMREFARTNQELLNAKGEALKSDNSFQKLVLSEIEQAAISKGFSLILNISDSAILWYGPDADITDEVISRLTADLAH